jgi:DNA polymerase III alpha subunit
MNNGTKLKNRILWYDGDSSYSEESLIERILDEFPIDDTVYITEFTKNIRKFNDLNSQSPLDKKKEVRITSPEWNIPEKYKNIDIKNYIFKKLLNEIEHNDFSQKEIDERISRIETEINLYNKTKLTGVLNLIIYIIDEFEKHNVVWGTGRGSSCCSYCLYLIGLHDVDSVEYNLDLSEFFKTK